MLRIRSRATMVSSCSRRPFFQAQAGGSGAPKLEFARRGDFHVYLARVYKRNINVP